MVYYEAYNPESELYHWGIKGMKWGVRRYQNPDGTLTEAGKRRYGTAENFNNVQKTKADKAASNKAAKEAKAQARRAAAEERAKMAVEKAIKNGNVKQIMRNRSGMTTQQLRDALDRASIVKKINELNGKKPGLLETIANGGNKISGAVNAVASVGESVKRVRKAFKDDEKEDVFTKKAKEGAAERVKESIKSGKSVDEAREQYRQAMQEISPRKKSASEKAGNKAGEKAAEKVIELQKRKAERDAEKAAKKRKKKKQPSLSDRVKSLNDISLNHSDYDARERVGSILMHHGIKGQKWGVRRFQNSDGSLTDAGKTRYTSPNAENRRLMNNLKQSYHIDKNSASLLPYYEKMQSAQNALVNHAYEFAKTAGSDDFNSKLKAALHNIHGNDEDDTAELRELTVMEYLDSLKDNGDDITSTYAFDIAYQQHCRNNKQYNTLYQNYKKAEDDYNMQLRESAKQELAKNGKRAINAWCGKDATDSEKQETLESYIHTATKHKYENA